MDKEAQEKITGVLNDCLLANRISPETYNQLYTKLFADQILCLIKELGYRKSPKDKPPLLSDEEMGSIAKSGTRNYWGEYGHDIAQAQREADIKYYEH